MNCQECESLFDEMIDRRVEEPTRQRMELHLSRCVICRDKLADRKRIHTLMFRALNGDNVRLHLPNGFADRLVAECRSQPKRSFFPALPRWALIAASLAIVAGFVFATAVTSGVFGGTEAETNTLVDAISPAPDVLDVPEVSVVPGGLGMDTLPSTISQLPTTIYQLPSTNYQLQTNQGEATMTKKKAAVAALASAMAAAPLTAANGDGYQYILSGDPVAAETAVSSSASSTTTPLTSGTLADGHVLASELEARYRTMGESAIMALRSDKFNAMIIIYK